MLSSLFTRLLPARRPATESTEDRWAGLLLAPGKIRVLIGPAEIARSYAARKRWAQDVRIVSDVAGLRQLDPAAIERIFVLKTRQLGGHVHDALTAELDLLRALYGHTPETVSSK